MTLEGEAIRRAFLSLSIPGPKQFGDNVKFSLPSTPSGLLPQNRTFDYSDHFPALSYYKFMHLKDGKSHSFEKISIAKGPPAHPNAENRPGMRKNGRSFSILSFQETGNE